MSTQTQVKGTEAATATAPKTKLSKLERRAQKNEARRIAKLEGKTSEIKDEKGVGAKTTDKTATSKKGKTEAKKDLDKANIEKAGATASGKELMYKYPEDCKTQAQKKTFRRNMRAENKKFSRTIAKLEKSTEKADVKELAKAQKEYAAWRKEHYTKA